MTVAYADTPQPTIYLEAICHTCKRHHPIQATPLDWLHRLDEWQQKHPAPEHETEFLSRKRYVPPDIDETAFVEANEAPWWLAYRENADFKLAYASSAAYTLTLESLASSATLVAGRESTAVSNTSNLYFGYLVGGHVTVHQTTAVTANTTIDVYLYGSYTDSPQYPTPLTGTDSAVTFTSVGTRDPKTAFFASMPVPATTANLTYRFRSSNIAPFFGGLIPKLHGVWVTQSTGQNLHNTTAGTITYTGAYQTG